MRLIVKGGTESASGFGAGPGGAPARIPRGFGVTAQVTDSRVSCPVLPARGRS
jgi:hypothetical protein